ncbi:MAG: type II/IV secretion system ATPase subunit [archaeon]
MGLFSRDTSYEIVREGEDSTLLVDCEKYPSAPSLEDSPELMSRTVEYLAQNLSVTRIIFTQKREYEYDYAQTSLLIEIARLLNTLLKQKQIFSYQNIASARFATLAAQRYTELQNLLYVVLKRSPLDCYVELRRILRREKIEMERTVDQDYAGFIHKYMSMLDYTTQLLEKTKIIQLAAPYLAGHKLGDRDVYRNIFTPSIKPDFMFTRLMAQYPKKGEEIDNYMIGSTEVVIFKLPDSVQLLYHIMPPEFKLSEEKYEILDTARKILSEHKPDKQEFIDPKRMREVFSNVGRDLLEELADYKKVQLSERELEELTDILIRYTVGFGLIEVLLADEKVQDITINSPSGSSPIFIVHADYDDCRTNIFSTTKDAESWASKLRLISGRPLDEANPILDTEVVIPGVANARVGVISDPLNPTGIAYAFRRHRNKPWTLPLFIKQNMLTPLGAGLISFLVDGSRTLLIAGTRSAGKSSLLGSVMVEIMRKYRILTIEDTLELPSEALQKLGYNIQQMKVAGALSKGTSEVPADVGIRTTLRLGDSCLIIGEVRSTEAKALYEAMRVGALANVVAGTIHGDSPYGVYDRVVNDLEVPKTSFKATDIIIVANPVKSADGLHRWRRVTQITEVRKKWEDNPLAEGGFVDLMKYDAKKDSLEPTDALINGDSEIIKSIAGNVKEWAGNWDAVWQNILLRAKTKEELLSTSKRLNNPELLEAEFVIQANDAFHKISNQVKEDVGSMDTKRIFFAWNEWLKKNAK